MARRPDAATDGDDAAAQTAERGTPGQREASGDRAATEKKLEGSALALLRENGILAGVNLREVADRVQVNRGLVYHYFGSRRGLLRSALRRRGEDLEKLVRGPLELPFVARCLTQLQVAAEGEYVRLLALLVLDGDPTTSTIPLREWSIRRMEREQREGELPDSTDREALLALMSAVQTGYGMFRQRYAAELDVPLAELDVRVAGTLEKMLTAYVAADDIDD